MPLLDIITAPHPILEAAARPVEDDEFGPELAQRTRDMAETMYAAPGVGLAAPQVSDPRRIVVIDPGEKHERGVRFFAMVNPEIVERSDETIPWYETCLSVPEIEVKVMRNKRVKVQWQQPEDGAQKEAWFEDYEAVIVQHELDHLKGTVLLDRVSRFKRARYLKAKKARAKAKAAEVRA
jgi:peptide deformylase